MMQQREQWIDAIKGFGIVLVVIGHASGPEKIELWIYGYHMPLFFFLSGMVFDDRKWHEKGFCELTKSKARAYLIPYMIFFVINLFSLCTFELLKNGIGGGVLL